MKKVFPFEVPGRAAPRVVEGIKAEVRKYLKREHRKALPEGVDFWDFDCRVGKSADEAEVVHVSAIVKAIDGASASELESVYIEILAKEGKRKPVVKETDVPVEEFTADGVEEQEAGIPPDGLEPESPATQAE